MKQPLYVFRPLLNVEAVDSWARAQGFRNRTPLNEYHVTIAYSREPVDIGQYQPSEKTVSAYGTGLKILGDEALVMVIKSIDLLRDHTRARYFGCSHDYASYIPHVTISLQFPRVDSRLISRAAPFAETLYFGPEEFRDIPV